MGVDWNKLPEFVRKDLAERGLEPSMLRVMEPAAVLNEYLGWNGIIGYTNDIYKAVHGIDAAEIN